MFKNLLIKCLTFMAFELQCQAFQVTYGFANVAPGTGLTDPGPFPNVDGLQLGGFTAVGLSSSPSASGRFSFTGWPLGANDGDDQYQNYMGDLSPFSFYRLGIRVNPGYTLSIHSVEFSVRRSSRGPRNFCVRSDCDNFTMNLSAHTGTNNNLAVIPTHVFFWKYDSLSSSGDQYGAKVLPAGLHQHIRDSVFLHIYAWNAEQTSGSFSIDNVKLTGYVYRDSTLVEVIEEADQVTYRIFPNPAKEELCVFASVECVIKVFDTIGRELRVDGYSGEQQQTRIHLKGFSPGMYWLQLTHGTRLIYKKFQVE